MFWVSSSQCGHQKPSSDRDVGNIPVTARFIATNQALASLRMILPEIIEKLANISLHRRISNRCAPSCLMDFPRPAEIQTPAYFLRVQDAQRRDGRAGVQDYLLRMGQSYFNWPTPDGYPDHSEAWQGSLMPRWQFAFALIRGEIKGTKTGLTALMEVSNASNLQGEVDSVSSLLMGAPLAAAIRDELIVSVLAAGASEEETLQIVTASLIASPAFQWR
jgi:hypothetical protein